MAQVKLTKNALRSEQVRLGQLEKYLPTLQLKKAMLQIQVNEVRVEILRLAQEFDAARLGASEASGLLSQHIGVDLHASAKVEEIKKEYENVAGVDIPLFEEVIFAPFEYSLLTTPSWLDGAVLLLRKMARAKARVLVAEEKKAALEKELREVSIRVNLFEKNLIPNAKQNIKRIKIFLGDQELAAVGQAKVAKAKIEAKKRLKKAEMQI
ncbi:MAG: V-type ATP synthase subunit D [Chlamydiae bacterium]|nr:V-type ATP synthase subunit D [Chlamydiota bacterium]